MRFSANHDPVSGLKGLMLSGVRNWEFGQFNHCILWRFHFSLLTPFNICFQNVVAGKQWQAYVSYSTILLLHSTDQESLWLCCSASAQITQPHAGNSYLATSSISDCCAPTLVQYQKSQEGRRKIHFNMQPPTTPKIPVDRDWIEKLLRKHAKAVPSRRGTSSECDEKCGDDIKPIKMKALVVAPMVDQSDLPFRLLCRRYGANLAVTPMIHARLLVTSETYRKKFIGNFVPEDRPLIAQICGSDPDIVLEAARYLEPHVDGIVSFSWRKAESICWKFLFMITLRQLLIMYCSVVRFRISTVAARKELQNEVSYFMECLNGLLNDTHIFNINFMFRELWCIPIGTGRNFA